jgi:CBS domain-containing protein
VQVKEVMTRDVEVVAPTARLDKAAEKMRALNIGSLPVCDGERVVGMLTDRDIAVRSTAESQHPRTVTVRDVMTPDAMYCFEDQDVAEAAEVMKQHEIRRLVVLDQDKRLAGVVTIDDLAVVAGAERLAGEVVRKAAQPTPLKE